MTHRKFTLFLGSPNSLISYDQIVYLLDIVTRTIELNLQICFPNKTNKLDSVISLNRKPCGSKIFYNIVKTI